MSFRDIFSRILYRTRERPVSDDWNYVQSMVEQTMLGMFGATFNLPNESSPIADWATRWVTFGATGVYAQSFLVQPNSGGSPFNLGILPGWGTAAYGPPGATGIDGTLGTDYVRNPFTSAPVVLSEIDTSLTVPTPPISGHSRIDIVEIRANYLATDPRTIGVYNPTTNIYDPTLANKRMVWDILGLSGTVNAPGNSTAPIAYKKGVDFTGAIYGASEPATTPGYIKIARINLDGPASAITEGMIVDTRPLLFPGGRITCSGNVRIPGTSLGAASLLAVDLPPGMILKMAYESLSAPSVGQSYEMVGWLIGGDPRPRFVPGSRGTITANSASSSPRIVNTMSYGITAMDAADVAILDGTDSTWTLLGTPISLPVGTAAAKFSLRVHHPSGSALSSDESCYFNYSVVL